MSSLSEFFDALWSAIDGQALSTLASERARSTEAFLGALGECLVWTTGKLIKGSDASRTVTTEDNGQRDSSANLPPGDVPSTHESPKEISRALISGQFERLVGGLGKALRVDENTAGTMVSAIISRIESFASGLSAVRLLIYKIV